MVEPEERLPAKEEQPDPSPEQVEQPDPLYEPEAQPEPPLQQAEQPVRRPPPGERVGRAEQPSPLVVLPLVVQPEARTPLAEQAESAAGMRLLIHESMHRRVVAYLLATPRSRMLRSKMSGSWMLRSTRTHNPPPVVPLVRPAARAQFANRGVAAEATIAASRPAVLVRLHKGAACALKALVYRMREPAVL